MSGMLSGIFLWQEEGDRKVILFWTEDKVMEGFCFMNYCNCCNNCNSCNELFLEKVI